MIRFAGFWLLICGFGYAESVSSNPDATISWRHDIQRAIHESQNVGKPLLVKFSTDWCGYCKKMQRDTFSDSSIARHVNSCFVPVHLDGDQHRSLVKNLGVRSYPTTLILSSKMKVVSKITGYKTPNQLSQELARVCTPDAKRKKATAPVPQLSVFGNKCPVSPIESGHFAQGINKHSLDYRGYHLVFTTEQNREKFAQAPHRYWPIADGQCVVSAKDEQRQQKGNLDYGLIYQHQVWIFGSDEHRESFKRNPEMYANWMLENQVRTGETVATSEQAKKR